MQGKPRKLISSQMILFELRKVIGNPYIHIFGVGLPVFMGILVTKIAESELPDKTLLPMIATSIYLGIGTLIPMATLLMGYAVSYAQELDKGIPERMRLFGIKDSISFCNRAVSDMIFIFFAFVIYFLTGCIFTKIKQPAVSGFISYMLCILLLSIILLALGHGIACICRGFGRTYCVSMIIYFAFMILCGMMGFSMEDLPKWAQGLAKLLPMTYINKDFYEIWTGGDYNYMPMVQSYLFLGAAAGILLFVSWKRPGLKNH